MKYAVFLSCGLLAACQTSTDPAAGGFINGVSGIASGAYDQRIADAEAGVAGAQARNDGLAAQLNARETELSQLQARIRIQRAQLAQVDSATAGRVESVLAMSGTGATDAAKLASLQQAVAAARVLSADLAQLAG